MADEKIVLLVHGWSVRSTDTYADLPARLKEEARRNGLSIDVKTLWLSRYVSFRDEVRLEDLSRAFEAALRVEIGMELGGGRRFAAITHSTGGPVVRDWWSRFYKGTRAPCPLSHLVMLAPANFGSALAQLGKARVGRIKAFSEGVEPGQGVLDWLELGSHEAFELNREWILSTPPWRAKVPTFPFVLTGQTIDHKLYDHVNSYTGEIGSDGVVRVAAANLNATYVRLLQEKPRPASEKKSAPWVAPDLRVAKRGRSPAVAMAVLPGLAHSGSEIGILGSIGIQGAHPAVEPIIRCLGVDATAQYEEVATEFTTITERTQRDEHVESHGRLFLPDTCRIRDRYTMIVVRVTDHQGVPVKDFDFILLGQDGSPNKLPPGFLVDKQFNKREGNTLTFYVNCDLMHDGPAVEYRGRTIRPALPGAGEFGFRIDPRPGEGFVRYLGAELRAREKTLEEFIRPNETILVDVVLRRVVGRGTFSLTQSLKKADFTHVQPGNPIDVDDAGE